jgi:MFS family permease
MASLTALRGKLKGVYYGWWVLLSTFLLGVISGGVFSHSNSIFFGPIRQELGLSSTQTSLIFSLARAEGSIAGPIVGPLVDRFGARPMIIFGGLIASLGFILLHWVDSYWAFLFIFLGIVSTGKSAGLGQTLLSAVNRWFVRRRSLAMSICITGFSSGGAFILPAITLGVHTIGWRDVMLYSGIFMALAVVPLGLMIRDSPESMGIAPEGLNQDSTPATPREGGPSAPRAVGADPDYSVREALRTSTFWVLSVATVLRVTLWGAVSLHSVEMMAWKGVDRETAGFLVALMFFLSIPMRLAAGVLGVRFPLQPLLCGGMMAAGLAVVSLLLAPGHLAVYLFVILMAVEQGGSTLNWVALGNFFGRASFASLMGLMSACFNIGMLLSPIYAGWIVDRTNSYALVLATFAPLYGLSALLYLVMRKPVPPLRRPPLASQPAAQARINPPMQQRGQRAGGPSPRD